MVDTQNFRFIGKHDFVIIAESRSGCRAADTEVGREVHVVPSCGEVFRTLNSASVLLAYIVAEIIEIDSISSLLVQLELLRLPAKTRFARGLFFRRRDSNG